MTVATRRSLLNRSSIAVLAAALAAAVQVGHARAAGANPPAATDVPVASIDEVVVTAQRREQRIQDVGIAMSAYSGEQLQKLGVQFSAEVARLTPGVSISAGAGGQSQQFTIRGVTQNDFADTVEPPNAVYVDDTYIAAQNGSIFGTFDLERAEVLKGPQGTLFGRNATGGLIHFIPNKPSKIPEGYIDATYGRYNHTRLEAAIGGPITDKVQFRVSGLYNAFDPIMKNIYPYGVSSLSAGQATIPNAKPGDIWSADTKAIRAQLQFTPDDKLKIRVSGSYYKDITGSDAYTSLATIAVYDAAGRLINVETAGPNETRMNIGANGANVTSAGVVTTAVRATPGGDFYGYRAPDTKDIVTSSDYAKDNINYVKSYDGAVHIDYDFGPASLVSITNYRRFDKFFTLDVDSGPENFLDLLIQASAKSVSQEFRLSSNGEGPLRWTLGAYYLYVDSKGNPGFKAATNSIFAGRYNATSTGIDLRNNVHLLAHSESAFGQIEYEFAPKLTLIAGARVIGEHQKYNFTSYAYPNTDDYAWDLTSAPLFQTQTPFFNKRSAGLWAGKLQLEYRPAKDVLAYFGVNRGVKAGGYNSPLPGASLPLSSYAYKPEELTSYEGGIKSSIFDRRLTMNVSAYYYDYHNYQAFTFAGASGVVSNNDAKNYGLEASISANPIEGLTVNAGLALTRARIYDLAINRPVGAAPAILRTVKPTFTPKQTYALQASYTPPKTILGGELTLAGDISWKSQQYSNIRNFDADIIKSYMLANIHAYWEYGHYRVGLGVDNVTDERYRSTNIDLATLCGCNEVSYGMPRFWNVSLRYSY